MKTVAIKPPYIKLGQLLKLLDLIESGGAEKGFLNTHDVMVNDVVEKRRGRKLVKGDIVKIDQQVYQIIENED